MDEAGNYREPDDAPHWSDRPTVRLLMIVGVIVAAGLALCLVG